MIPRNLCNPNPATPSEKSFITPGQQMASRTVGNDQNFQQSKRRRNQFPASIVDLSEKPLKQRNELGMFLDEVDEDDGVHTHRAAPEIGHQSHELRSRATCMDGSTSLQFSLPSPSRSRMDNGFGVSRASLSSCVISRAIDRCWRFARA